MTLQLITERFPDIAVRPEAHGPDMRQGDLVRLPFFPNAARRKEEWRKHISDLETELSALKTRYDAVDERQQKLENSVKERLDGFVSMLNAQNQRLDEGQRKLDEHLSLPQPPVAKEASEAPQLGSVVWLAICACVCVFVIVPLFVRLSPPLPQLAISLFGVMTGVSYLAALGLWFGAIGWVDYGRLWIAFFRALRISERQFVITTLFYTATLVCIIVTASAGIDPFFTRRSLNETFTLPSASTIGESRATPSQKLSASATVARTVEPSGTPVSSQSVVVSLSGTVVIHDGNYCNLSKGIEVSPSDLTGDESISLRFDGTSPRLYAQRTTGLAYVHRTTNDWDSITKFLVKTLKYVNGKITIEGSSGSPYDSIGVSAGEQYAYSLGNERYGKFRVVGLHQRAVEISYVNFP